jgi:hypothetical protein
VSIKSPTHHAPVANRGHGGHRRPPFVAAVTGPERRRNRLILLCAPGMLIAAASYSLILAGSVVATVIHLDAHNLCASLGYGVLAGLMWWKCYKTYFGRSRRRK